MNDKTNGAVKIALSVVIAGVIAIVTCLSFYFADKQVMAENIKGNTVRIKSIDKRLDRIDNKLDTILYEVKK